MLVSVLERTSLRRRILLRTPGVALSFRVTRAGGTWSAVARWVGAAVPDPTTSPLASTPSHCRRSFRNCNTSCALLPRFSHPKIPQSLSSIKIWYAIGILLKKNPPIPKSGEVESRGHRRSANPRPIFPPEVERFTARGR